MSLKIALILSVLLQFLTAIISLTLIKRTKTNVAWWLISIGFILMAIRRFIEMYDTFMNGDEILSSNVNSWLGVGISVLMLISLSFIKRIFNIQERLDKIKSENESRVFSAIISTEEKQKHQFSRELHDGLAPLLSLIKLSLTSLSKDIRSENELKVLNNTEKLIDESLKTVKEISNNLSPHVLVNFGLLKAIKSFANRIPENNIPAIHIESNIMNKRYDHTVENVIYRIICELITNSIKHANARNINIALLQEENTLNITYMDDGIGFEYDSSQNITEFGFGLANIVSRTKSIHGIANFYSKPDQGFNADFTINL